MLVSEKDVSFQARRITDKTRPINKTRFSKRKILGIFLPSRRVTIKPSRGKNNIITESCIKKFSLIHYSRSKSISSTFTFTKVL